MPSRFLVLVASVLFSVLPGQSQPSIDYHQHLLSPSAARLGSLPKPFTAPDLISLLDAVGVRRALVLSLGYQYGNPNKATLPDEYLQVQRENDWTAGQVAKYPNRLRAFCSVDPLKSYAISEIERCAKNDICGVAGVGRWEEKKALIAQRIRQIGVARILWGSDGAFDGGMTPAEALQAYRELPLTKEEFHVIDNNVTPYIR